MLLTLAVFAFPFAGLVDVAGHLALTGLAVVVLMAVFVGKPSAFPVSLIIATAAGGVLLDFGGTTPRLFFATATIAAYLLSAFIRKTLATPPRRDSMARSADGQLPAVTIVAVLLGVYLLLLVPSLGQIESPQRSLYILLMRAVTLIGAIVLARDPRMRASHRDVLFAAMVAGSLIAGAYIVNAVALFRATSFVELASALAIKDNTIQVSVLGTTNTIASFLAFTIPLSVAFLLAIGRGTRGRLFVIAAVVLQSFGLIATASRGGVAALLGGILVAALICTTSIAQFRRLLGLVVVSSSLVVVGVLFAQHALRDHFVARFAVAALWDYIPRRVELWESSWRAFQQSPLIGIGVGNVGFFDRDFGTGEGAESHNLVLQSLSEEGLVAAVVLVVVLLIIIRKNVRATRFAGSYQLWVVVAVTAALINAMVEPTFWQPGFAALFWIAAVTLSRQADRVTGLAASAAAAARLPVPSSQRPPGNAAPLLQS